MTYDDSHLRQEGPNKETWVQAPYLIYDIDILQTAVQS